MTGDQALDEIQKRWIAGWDAAVTARVGASYAPIASSFDDELAAAPAPATPYALLSVETGIGERLTMGSPAKFLTSGTIYAKLHWPLAASNGFPDGGGWIQRMAEAVKDTLSVAQFGNAPGEDGVITRVASVSPPAQDGAHWIVAVTLPFEFTETRSAGH